MTAKTITKQLSEFMMGLQYEDVPESIKERCIDLLIDHLAVAYAGKDLPWTKIMIKYGYSQRSSGLATVYGGQKITAELAALINGTMAHGIELDDTHEASVSHPGAVVFASVLAVAQERGASYEETLTAIIVGYEAMGRIGMALDSDFMARGSHPTAKHGVFGACAGVAKILGLSADELNIAWGISTSLTSGSMAFTEDPLGTMVKRLHAGWPAYTGIVAARLAGLGFTGPRDTLDNAKGYIGSHTNNPDRTRILTDLGRSWIIDSVSIKPYACCRLFHSAIDAINSLMREHSFSWKTIKKVTGYGPRPMIDGHLEYRPESVMAAQYSLPFSLAVALVRNAENPRNFNVDRLTDTDILGVCDKVTGEVCEKLDRLFPEKYAARIEIILDDDKLLVKEILNCSGSPLNPLDREQIKQKYMLLTKNSLSEDEQNVLLRAIEGIGDDGGIVGLFESLTGDRNGNI